jgi:hypothetical protein
MVKAKRILNCACVAALMSLVAACGGGGGGSTASSGGGTVAATVVQGVATPSGVSVVTAKNSGS